MSEQQALLDEYHRLSNSKLDKAELKRLEDLQHQIDSSGIWNIDQQVEKIISQLSLPRSRKLNELSGGWRRRVALGKALVSEPELLLLDEATNDLDVEVLEQRLVDYTGTLLIVSHDRVFLDNVVTSILVFEADGGVKEYVGGYNEWAKRGNALTEADVPDELRIDGQQPNHVQADNAVISRKLSYKLQRELDELPLLIKTLENDIDFLQEQIAQPSFYDKDYEET